MNRSELALRSSARRSPRPASAIAWSLAAVAVVVACGSVDSRTLENSETPAENAGALSGSGKGGRSSGTGGMHGGGTVGSGGTNPAGGDDFDAGGTGDTGGNPATCGNGRVEKGEGCDDGNVQPGDGCDTQCQKEECGNGRVDAGEECDPPSAGRCTDHCNDVKPTCGDGKVQGSEDCDDGNDEAGDGCFECRKECGDGKIDASLGEECEPEYAPQHCSLDCHWLPTCGDGVVQPELGEQCDTVSATCAACRVVTPPLCDGEGGCGGQSECTPDGGTVHNGSFDATSDGWTPSGPGVTLAVVSDGSPEPRSLEVSYASSPVRSEAGAYQCVPVGGALKYTFDGRYFIPADAPDGVGAAVTALLYSGTQCSGTFLKSFNGPLGSARDAWTPYSFQLDMSQVSASPPLRLMLRIDVVRPENVDESRVRWDSVALTAPGPRCGDCSVDTGEQCDDGARNGSALDHCSSDCHVQRCGDGVVDSGAGEQCDDGNTTFGGADTCTPGCRQPNACDTCAASACKSELDACFGLKGVAAAGPRAGTARSTLCDELLTCIRSSACDLVARPPVDGKPAQTSFIESCYCGTAGAHCFDENKPANGTCRAQTEAALESTDPATLIGRFDGQDTDYPAFGAVRELIACETTSCNDVTECTRTPQCGDGVREDRHLTDDIMTVGGKEVPCDDSLTTTGRGCIFEECDGGPGCDEYCLLAGCGNYVIEAGEDCDDGADNGKSTSGCSADCTAKFHCHTENGNGVGIVLEPPYEECDRGALGDPANDGAICSQADARSNPNSCACDDKCQLVVCGNGVIQKGEQCDPPNGSTCDDDCKIANQGPCVSCIEGSMDATGQQTYCDPDSACPAVEACVAESKCFNPLAAFCYCGITDIDACAKQTFTPTGPCRAEILAGEPTAANNADALNQLFDFTTPTGVAFNILSDLNGSSSHECQAECF